MYVLGWERLSLKTLVLFTEGNDYYLPLDSGSVYIQP